MTETAVMPEFPLKGKYVAMLAPSFVVEFEYPSIISRLKKLGFDKVVELTFGAKMINGVYHRLLKKNKGLLIASPCPGIVEIIKSKMPQYSKNLANVDSPMTVMGKICRKTYPHHKIVFISPCNFKKVEAGHSKYVDYVIDYKQLHNLFDKYKIGEIKDKVHFDKFYNDYTKIFPLAGGLGKTAHLKGVIKEEEVKEINGFIEVLDFLKNPDPKIRFLDVLFCKGGCIGGPCVTNKLSLEAKRKKVLDYLELSKEEDIPKSRKGIVEKAKGITFTRKI